MPDAGGRKQAAGHDVCQTFPYSALGARATLTKILSSNAFFFPQTIKIGVHKKNVTFTDLNRRLAHKLHLIAAATLVLIASGA